MNSQKIVPSLKQKKSKELKESRLKAKLRLLVLSSTIHGFSKLFEKRNIFLKLLWAVCFIASIGGCGYFLFNSISDYLNFDVVTKMSIIHENPMLFPTVVICNRNPFESAESNLLILNLIREMRVDVSSSKVLDLYKLRFLLSNNAFSHKLTESQKKTLGIPLEKILLFCSFNFQECSADDFEWYYDMMFGNCYKFNSGKNFKKQNVPLRYSTKEGMLYGLTMFLHMPNTNAQFNLDMIQGMHVFIQNASVDSYLTDGSAISKGYIANMQVKKVVNEKVPYPYSECKVKPDDDYDSYLYRQTLKSHRVYQQRDCFDLCVQRESIRKCGCHMVFLESLNSTTPCLNPAQINCSFELGRTFFENQISKKCSECPVECNTESFEVSTTLADFSSKRYLDVLLQNPIMADFRARIPRSDVVYEKMRGNSRFKCFLWKTSIRKGSTDNQNNYKRFNIRNRWYIRLFLGISFLSFIEFLEIFLIVFSNLVLRKK